MAPETDFIDARVAPVQENLGRHLRSVDAYGSAFENANVGIGHIALTGHWQYANKALARILGYGVSELHLLTCQEMTHPDELQLDADRVLKLLSGELEHYAIDKRFRRSDGQYIWTRKTLVVKRKDDGDPEYLIALIEDIDHRKRAEVEKAFLIQELAHRSRNLLSVISSLTSLLAPTCKSVAEFEERLLDRLHAIARSNDHLLGRNSDGASITALVHTQLNAFMAFELDRVTLHGPDILINAKCSHSLGLALYELTSNALKYGALSAPGGRITLTWTEIGFGPGAIFRFEWREYPALPVTSSARTGFGTTVLESVAPLGVRGTALLTADPEGYAWRLDAPLSAVLSPS